MKIKIDCKLLSEQISFCDAYAEHYGDTEIGNMFNGIANLLSHICFAVEEDEEIVFERKDK